MITILEKRTFDAVVCDVDCSLLLASGETITGTPTFTTDQVTTPPLAFASPVVNTVPVTYADGHVAAIGQVAQVRISGGTLGVSNTFTLYTIRMHFTTSIGNTLEATVYLRVTDYPL